MSGRAVKEYYVASTVRDMFQMLGGVGSTPHTAWNSHCVSYKFLPPSIKNYGTLRKSCQGCGSTVVPATGQKRIWKQVYSELYIKSKVFCIHTMKVYGDLGCSFTSQPFRSQHLLAGWAADLIWMLCKRNCLLFLLRLNVTPLSPSP
jgi:hypothetical protein